VASPAEGVLLYAAAATGDAPLQTFPLTGANVVASSSSGSLVAGGTPEGEVVVWDVSAASEGRAWRFPFEVERLAFSPNGELLAVVMFQPDSVFCQTQIIDLQTGEPLFDAPMPDWRIVKFSEDSRRVYAALDVADHIVEFSLAEAAVVNAFSFHDTTIAEMQVSPDGEYVVSVSNDRDVRVYNSRTRSSHVLTSGMQGDVMGIAFGPRSRSAVIGSSLGLVRVCNLHAVTWTVDLLRQFDPGEPTSLALASDGRYLALRWRLETRVFDLFPEGVPADLAKR
jgi:WD40 repeat protein